MTPKVVTFYSYKGGVGRSFALANIAVVLAQWGFRVLTVDWDIEAPGLNHYFEGRLGKLKAGVIDYLDDCRRGKPHSWDHYAVSVQLPGSSGVLRLMPAEAHSGRDYAALVQSLDWDDLYGEHALGAKLETLRAQWLENFDFVLIDSRTGMTDFSGLTTAQLPDVLAFMFTANEQSLGGCADVARRAMEARRKMPVDRPAILPLPIPGRFEQREEYERAQEWRSRFRKKLQPFFDAWVPKGIDTLKLIDSLTIPYVPRWTFGEELAVLEEPAGSDGVRSPSHSASFACETLAALLVHEFGNIELLTSSRDEFVHGARRRAVEAAQSSGAAERRHIFVSTSLTDWSGTVQEELGRRMRSRGDMSLVSYPDQADDESGYSVEKLRQVLDLADAYIIILDDPLPSRLSAELRMIQRTALRGEITSPIIPLVRQEGEKLLYKSGLAHYQGHILRASDLGAQLDKVLDRLAGLLFHDIDIAF